MRKRISDLKSKFNQQVIYYSSDEPVPEKYTEIGAVFMKLVKGGASGDIGSGYYLYDRGACNIDFLSIHHYKSVTEYEIL